MKLKSKFLILTLVTVFALGATLPAKAFYLELPEFLQYALQNLQSAKTFAQEAPPPMTSPPPSYTPPPSGSYTTPPSDNYTPPSSGSFTPPPSDSRYMPPSGDQQQMYQPNQNTPDQNRYDQNQQPQPNRQYQNQNTYPQQGMQNGQDQRGSMGGQENKQFMKDMKREVKRVESQLRKFESQFKDNPEMLQKAAEVKAKLDKINSAQTSDELMEQDLDPGSLGGIMQELEEARREAEQCKRMKNDMKRGLKGMKSGVNMFEKQLKKLSQKGIATPANIQENIDKIKTMLQKIETGDSCNIEELGMDEMPDLFQNLDESRQQLEMLTRWPEMKKMMNKELKKLQTELKKAKSAADRLNKKGIDVYDILANFESAVAKLQVVGNEAEAKLQSGDAEGAMELLESDFYGQMEDVWQYNRMISMVTNLGKFTSESQRGINNAKRMITQLKRQKKDVSELQDLLEDATAKRQEIINTLKSVKASEVDEEGVITMMEEMENLKQEFDDNVSELTGKQAFIRPWDEMKPSMQKVEMSDDFERYIPEKPMGNNISSEPVYKPTNPVGESNPQPSPRPNSLQMVPGASLTNPVGESNPSPAP